MSEPVILVDQPVTLVDCLNLVFRCHYASPKLAFEGTPTSVLHGFLRTILDLREHVSKRIVFCWDHGIPVPGVPRSRNWREDVLPTYKANRAQSESWPMICPQLLPLANAINYLGYSNVTVMGLEADDIIGILSQELQVPPPGEVLIFSTDKDLYQLLDETYCHILVPKKEGGKFKKIFQSGVEMEFGIPVSRWAEYLALGGDHSDNIKPMRGMGPKTAIKLIQAGVDLSKGYCMYQNWSTVPEKYKAAWPDIQKSYHAARIPRSWSDPRIRHMVVAHQLFVPLKAYIVQTAQTFPNQQARLDGQAQFARFLAQYGLESLFSVRRKFFDNSIPEELLCDKPKRTPPLPPRRKRLLPTT
jgi:5'-3' exonuclease